MTLEDLAAYAEDKYHIREQHKWADFPGFSVLTDPHTGKWAALLMRQWDYEAGEEIQRCDIKCGKGVLEDFHQPCLSKPFRMKGEKWVGVTMNARTEAAIVCRLFDMAMEAGALRAADIVLEEMKGAARRLYRETALPPRPHHRNAALPSRSPYRDTALPPRKPQGGTDKRNEEMNRPAAPAAGFGRTDAESPGQIPDQIMQMLRLYEFGDGSKEARDRNFYRQGKFMENYEDDAPWNGPFRRYFTTYHDLNIVQLRGYFTWRTRVRRGEFGPIAASLAYIYIYELLNGIGASGAQDALNKMLEFEKGFVDSGIGDPSMRANLRRWMLEFAVLCDLDTTTALQFTEPELIRRDYALMRLRDPASCSDKELFEALDLLSGGKTEKSSALIKERERAVHLFAGVWRYMTEHYESDGWDIFTACFGKIRQYPWHPLANAVYYDQGLHKDREYALDGCRKYICRGGVWTEERYDHLFFDRYRIHEVVHEADRQIRRYLKTGHYLKEKESERWVTPFVESVLAADRAAAEEARRPRITIDLAGLDRIRRDALVTRDSLLTEEEMDEDMLSAEKKDGFLSTASSMEKADESAGVVPPMEKKDESADDVPAMENAVVPADTEPSCSAGHINSEEYMNIKEYLQDADCAQILQALLAGEPVEEIIRGKMLMPSVVADTINEAFYDEIGDSVLFCDGETITLVEDYREDLEELLNE